MYIIFNIAGDAKVNNAIGNKMRLFADDKEYIIASDVKNIISQIRNRGEAPERILFAKDIFVDPELELNKLKTELIQYPQTEVLFISDNTPKSKAIARMFTNIMRSPNYAVLVFPKGEINSEDVQALTVARVGTLIDRYSPESVLNQPSGEQQGVKVSRRRKYDDADNVQPVDTDDEDDLSMGDISDDIGDFDYNADPYEQAYYDTYNNNDDVAYNEYSNSMPNVNNQQRMRSEFEQAVLSESNSKFIIFVGDDASNAHACATDTASYLYELGQRVLVMDLDDINNFILSRFDIDTFYLKHGEKGIDNQNIYVEDGIDLLSNGFGVPIKSDTLKKLFDLGVVNNYDCIVAHCPIERLDVLPLRIVNQADIRCIIKPERAHLLKAIKCVTDRRHVSAIMEDALYAHTRVFIVMPQEMLSDANAQGYLQEDLDFIKNNIVFTRENWAKLVTQIVE